MKQRIRDYQDAIYEQLGRIGKAVSSPRRIELLELLAQGPRTVEVLAEESNLSIANTSQHLRALRSARLVDSTRKGTFASYYLAGDEVRLFLDSLKTLAEKRLSELQQIYQNYMETHGGLEPVNGKELYSRITAGEVTVVDVRPAEEYRAGHIPGAISMPVDNIKNSLTQLPEKQDVVVYCRDHYCVFAAHAVESLRRKGINALCMEDGFLEWKAQGLPLQAEENELMQLRDKT
jgi:rhodanese-related sulfurtransferase/predicted transcriptional regulator